MQLRTIFYIDGFNFYYGLRTAKAKIHARWQQYYWIDLVGFCRSFLDPNIHELVCVKYFTAMPLDPNKASRQTTFFNANRFVNNDLLRVIYGKYYTKTVKCNAIGGCHQEFDLREEKRTDVNISVNLIEDCVFDNVDLIVLISADSDLVPPLEFIRRNYPNKRIKIFFPPRRNSFDLNRFVRKKAKRLENNEGKFRSSIMDNIIGNDEISYEIPPSWVYIE
ncbi:MAG: NYN domain-containing protein [Chitinophagales bacterium]|nr:NYN domain-containing protein [Chitinophagales bacterium]HAE13183.1 NYN domain-containing protein [Bacteroidota bacterium]MCB9021110.1 NYN domain-containing protein [Chitinophagales bacterium]HPE96486.1 NYN domain-containing protein [Chitinophagales bacterium]HQU38295.1 NYN domain-containing protein [Chitinophagales bacterium]